MKTIYFTEARDNPNKVLDRVVNDAGLIVINRSHEAGVVVMSFRDYSSLMETVHLLRSPKNSAHLGRSITQYKERWAGLKNQ